MSDDFHRPTYTSDDPNNIHGAFNATQVRLYGIPGLSRDADPPLAEMYSATGAIGSLLIKLDNSSWTNTENNQQTLEILTDLFRKEGPLKDVLEKAFGGPPQKVDHAHVFVNAIMRGFVIMVSAMRSAPPPDMADVARPLTCGVIFGYAYEGHTYDLPKPKVMLIEAKPQPIPNDDSGYTPKAPAGYMVWLVDKLDQCVEVDINQGFIEQIVLEANLPGKRSPSMYAGRMLVSHRSGRLTE